MLGASDNHACARTVQFTSCTRSYFNVSVQSWLSNKRKYRKLVYSPLNEAGETTLSDKFETTSLLRLHQAPWHESGAKFLFKSTI
jgi:hypothetical protein